MTEELKIFYLILILPFLFGLTLLCDGLEKVLRGEMRGWWAILWGLFFEGIVILAYWYLAGRG